MRLFSALDHRVVVLDREIARGGEGAIFTVRGEPGRLAKRYLTAPSAERVDKLLVMARAADNALVKVAAWPTELLVPAVADPPSKTIAFLMPRAPSPDQLHELYTPRSRQKAFPQADLRFILHVAANVVRAFGAVHKAGHVIGDVNHGHLLVDEHGRVTLIDCDSFQIAAAGRVFTCDVGVPLFTAPELQGRSFRGLNRTANHDHFGLAVLLFHLLFMGRHPYAGVPVDPRQPADIEAAIQAGRFAYGAHRRRLGIEQPPGTIPLATYGSTVATLFERAFASTMNPERPDETAWLAGLVALQNSLKRCNASAAHQFPNHLQSCPWCALEARTGMRLFGTRIQAQSEREIVDLAALWQAIEMAPRPQPIEALALDRLKAPPRTAAERAQLGQRSARKTAAVASFLAGLIPVTTNIAPFWAIAIGAVAALVIWPKANETYKTEARKKLGMIQAAHDSLVAEWQRAANGVRFREIEADLRLTKEKLGNLSAERSRRLAELTSHAQQLERYLDRFRVDTASISGIGPGRAAALASFGIETAADVSENKVRAIPGFGPALAGNLVSWRAAHEARFRFDPNQRPTAADVAAMDADILTKRHALLFKLKNGPTELRRSKEEAESVQLRLKPLIEQRYIEILITKRTLNDL